MDCRCKLFTVQILTIIFCMLLFVLKLVTKIALLVPLRDVIRLKIKKNKLSRHLVLTNYFCAKSLTLAVPTKLYSCNPSIFSSSNGWVICVRAHNYTITKRGRFKYHFTSSKLNENWILKLNNNLRTVDSVRINKYIYKPLEEHLNPMLDGLQDCRLFNKGDDMFVLGTSANSINNTNIMTVGSISGQEIDNMFFMLSPKQQRREKNWMPILDSQPLAAIYSLAPFCVITLETQPKIIFEQIIFNDLSGYHGSSQMIKFKSGWIGVVHKRISLDGYAWYIHRLLFVDSIFTNFELSQEFFFEKIGIEFCAGIARKGSRFIFSYGVNDAKACLLELDEFQVSGLLQDGLKLHFES